MGGVELAKLGIRPASSLTAPRDEYSADRLLPVHSALAPLLPGAGLLRGSTVSLAAAGPGVTSLVLALMAAASAAGSYCAVIGMPELTLAAAARDFGIALDRFAVVPRPGPEPAAVAAAMLDGFEIVVLAAPGRVAPQLATQLSARARQSGSVLIATGSWPGATVTLTSHGGVWFGRGRLRCRRLTVSAAGRGAASGAREHQVWLPADPAFQQNLPTEAIVAPPALRVVR